MPLLRAITGRNPGPGHGEGFVWQASPDSPVIAVDAGKTRSVGQESGACEPQVLVLSHDDNDHIGGAVDLINSCNGSLEELWVPAEWGILIRQIAFTSPDELIPEGAVRIELSAVEAHIATQTNIVRGELRDGLEVQSLVTTAWDQLQGWSLARISPERELALQEAARVGPAPWWPWYGAPRLEDIFARTVARSTALLAIFRAALAAGVRIRFFSIDLALSSIGPYWEQEGRPGTATLANAAEVPAAPTILLRPGLPTTYALHLLSVQNRRALSTLLWAEPAAPGDGAIVWSDTDGVWLNHSSPRGFGAVVGSVSVSSAPHHASANSAHDRVWQELALLPDTAVMICAGGIARQGYRREYLALHGRRCCTWCRHTQNPNPADVEATSQISGAAMTISRQCLGVH